VLSVTQTSCLAGSRAGFEQLENGARRQRRYPPIAVIDERVV
jgi:hypothetical protein